MVIKIFHYLGYNSTQLDRYNKMCLNSANVFLIIKILISSIYATFHKEKLWYKLLERIIRLKDFVMAT